MNSWLNVFAAKWTRDCRLRFVSDDSCLSVLSIMSVIVPPLTNNHHHHHQSPYFPTMNNHNGHRRLHGTQSSGKTNQSPMKPTENDTDGDHVPFGVVNSMKQRLLNKVNESFLLNHNSPTLTRPSLSKPSSRLSSNENLLQTKTLTSPLKRTTRLSRSQDNLSHNHSIPSHPIIAEPFTSYLQPKQDVIIVDTTTINHQHSQENGLNGICDQDDDGEDDLGDGKLRPGHKTSAHRQSYTELHRDEAPKPGRFCFLERSFPLVQSKRITLSLASHVTTNTEETRFWPFDFS